MHAFIFWGFLVLFPTIVEAMLAIVNPDWTLPILGHAAWFAFLADLFATMVAVGVGIAFYIRKVQKPDRFRGSHMGEADRILLTILSIVATLLLWNATQIALGTFSAPERGAGGQRAVEPVRHRAAHRGARAGVRLGTRVDRARIPDVSAEVQAPAHHHGGAERLLREERAERVSRPRAHRPRERGGGHAVRRGDRAGPVEEAAARPVQLHRVRTLSGGLPRVGHREAAVPEAADHGSARPRRRHRPGRDGRGHRRAAAARAERRHRRGRLGLRHLRGVRARVPGRHRARRHDRGPAPQPRDGRVALPDRGGHDAARRRGAEREPVGTAGGLAHRLDRRHPGARVATRRAGARVPVLGRVRRGVR